MCNLPNAILTYYMCVCVCMYVYGKDKIVPVLNLSTTPWRRIEGMEV
jgi:hypothetical protein